MAYGDVSWCLCIRSVASKCELRVVGSVWVRSAVVIELMCVCVLFFFISSFVSQKNVYSVFKE